jgi:hypothetical protein
MVTIKRALLALARRVRYRYLSVVYTCVNSTGKTDHIASTGEKAVEWCRKVPDTNYEVFAVIVDGERGD